MWIDHNLFNNDNFTLNSEQKEDLNLHFYYAINLQKIYLLIIINRCLKKSNICLQFWYDASVIFFFHFSVCNRWSFNIRILRVRNIIISISSRILLNWYYRNRINYFQKINIYFPICSSHFFFLDKILSKTIVSTM